MPEKEVMQNPTTIMWIVGLGVGIVSGLHLLLYRIIGVQIANNTTSIETCFAKNDKTFVPRKEYEASKEAIEKRQDDFNDVVVEIGKDIKKLLLRDQKGRTTDA